LRPVYVGDDDRFAATFSLDERYGNKQIVYPPI
jgi:hypothetical protein